MLPQTLNSLPALKLIDDTLFIDNSRLGNFTTCGRKGEYAIVRGRVPAGLNAALFHGEVNHLCQKLRYQYYDENKPIPDDCVARQHLIIDKCFDDVIVPVDEFRTSVFAKAVVNGYRVQWPQEEFKIISDKGGKLVEKSFAIKVGNVGNIKVVWMGRIDLMIVIPDGRYWVVDHKTSSIGGEYAITEYYNSSQMQGYCWSAQRILGVPFSGVIINQIIGRKPTRTGKGTEYMRYRIPYDQDSLNAWAENIMHIASDFLNCHRRGYFPQHTTQCVGRYGQCPYLKVCQMSPNSRLQYLYSGDFKQDDWSPLHKDRVNLDEIMNMEIPNQYRDEVANKQQLEQHVSIDVTKLIHDIMEQAPTDIK